MIKTARGALAAVAIVVCATAAQAQDWPARPLTMVVPSAAGSASDAVGRILAEGLSAALSQQVIVENVGGSSGMTGAARVANAPPDGYQFLLGSVDTMAIDQTLYKNPPYNSNTDFTPAGLVIEQPIILITRADLPVNSLPEFIAYTKVNQSRMQFGSDGIGSGSHLACARLNAAIGAEPAHVPYSGSAQALQDLAAGRIDYFCALGADAIAPLQARTAKAIAVLGRDRSPQFPDIATAAGQGLPNVDSYFWSGWFFPKDTPDPVVMKMAVATAVTLGSAATQKRLERAGGSVVARERRPPAFLRRFIGAEIEKWAAAIKASGVSME